MTDQEYNLDNDILQVLQKMYAKASKKPLGWEKKNQRENTSYNI